MRLYVWRGEQRNFGDELNTLLWPCLLPGLLDDRGADLFLGIGSVLDARHAPHGRKVVAGAGYGGYEAPASLDGSWDIYWVRGPRTARRLDLPTAFGLGDPASLLPLVHAPATRQAANAVGFMPHFESLARGPWAAAAASAGVRLIDPRGDPRAIYAAIAGCRLLLSEALHGAIVADALRVPWVALRPVAAVHRMKWHDWAEAMALTPRFQVLPAASSREWTDTALPGVRLRLRRALAGVAERFSRPGIHLDRAVAALRQAADAAPQLSPDAALDRAQTRMLIRLHTLRQDRAGSRQRPRGPLRPGGKSAYDTPSVG
jgi:succinoglycan biosynthesis protein ExoV